MKTNSGRLWSTAYRCVGKGIFICVALAPFAAAALTNYSGLREEWINLVIPSGRRLNLLINSVKLAFGVSLTALAISFFSAVWFYQQKAWIIRWAKWLLIVLVPIPPYVHALAWSWLITKLPQNLTAATVSGGLISGWVQIMSFLPLAVGASVLAVSSVNKDLIESARISQEDKFVLWRIIFPLAAPLLLSAAGFIFTLSLLDYSIPSLFQYNVYAMEIFADFSAFYNPARALLLASPLIIIAFVTLILLLSNLRSLAMKPPSTSTPNQIKLSLPVTLQAAQRVCIFILGLQIAVPLISHLSLVGSYENFIAAIKISSNEISKSFQVSLATAGLCVFSSLPIASLFTNQARTGIVWWIITLIPLAIPAPLVGIGLESLWNNPGFQAVYTGNSILILASAARFLPFAVLLLTAYTRRVDHRLIDAARIYQKDRFHSLIKVILPMFLPGMLIAAAVVFVLSLGELGASILVIPPGKSTLTLRIYNFLHYGASGTVAGLSLVVTLVVVIVGTIVILSVRRNTPLFKRRTNR